MPFEGDGGFRSSSAVRRGCHTVVAFSAYDNVLIIVAIPTFATICLAFLFFNGKIIAISKVIR